MGVYKKGINYFIDYQYKGKRKRKKIGPDKKLAGLKDIIKTHSVGAKK